MKKVFVYPVGDPTKSNARNPYIFDMLQSISKKYILVNKPNSFTNFGILNALLNFRKTNTYILNWTENIPDRRFGFFQVIFFFILNLLIKIRNKEFVWILHNKKNHNKNGLLNRMSMYFSSIFSTKIITHSSEGITFLKEKYGSNIAIKAKYIPHPTNTEEFEKIERLQQKITQEYDFIIWGAINKYKGIFEFIKYVSENPNWQNKKILICGKCSNSDYLKSLYSFKNKNITIIEGYIENNDLTKYISKSSAILFVYHKSSVLSSGALIKSLYYKKPIIGPNTGAFKDLKKEELVMTYDTFDEILTTGKEFKTNSDKIEAFIQKNQWDNSIFKIVE